jgi:hypothetical protein
MKQINYTQQDGTPNVLSTTRQEGTTLYFTSRGDDIENAIVGKGSYLSLVNPSGLTDAYSEVSFLEDIYLKDGIAFWQNAVMGDEISVEVVLKANTPLYVASQTGNFNKDASDNLIPATSWDGSWLILPTDHVLDRFVNSVMIMGDNTHGLNLESSTSAVVPKECKLRLSMNTATNNTAIGVNICLELYRTKTV